MVAVPPYIATSERVSTLDSQLLMFGKRVHRNRLHTTIAEFQRSAYDAFLLDSSEDPERGKALELFKKETQDALKAIDKLQGWE